MDPSRESGPLLRSRTTGQQRLITLSELGWGVFGGAAAGHGHKVGVRVVRVESEGGVPVATSQQRHSPS